MVKPDGGENVSDWVRDYYDDVDNMRMDEFIAWHTDDVRVRFANNPEAQGHDQVRGAIGHFWEEIRGLKHNIVNAWETGGTAIVEAQIDYTRKDGNVVTVPCTTVLRRPGDKIDSVRIYMDPTPIFAPIEAVQAR